MSLFPRLRSGRNRHDASNIDLSSAEIAKDPFPHYEVLRRVKPVQFLPHHNFWIVLGYDAVKSAFAQPEAFSNAPYEDVDAVLLAADPPRQTAVRRVLAKRFSAQAVSDWAGSAKFLAREAVRPELDVVSDYGFPISQGVAAELIGFDANSVAEILDAAHKAKSAATPLPAFVRALDAIAPRAELYEALLKTGDGLLSDADARSLVRLMWLAATTTTERVITRCVLYLLQNDFVRRNVSGDLALLPAFVEEILRLHPPEHMLPRLATRPVELGGADIPSGAIVQLCVSAANRDPAHFNHPDSLILDRPAKRHFAFGGGVHHCIGASLSRQVAIAAVGALLRPGMNLRALQSLDDIRYFQTATALTPERLVIGL